MDVLSTVSSWVNRLFGLEAGAHANSPHIWTDYHNLNNPEFGQISPNDLVDLASWRREERTKACGGNDPIKALPAYSQDSLAYNDDGRMVAVSPTVYSQLNVEQKVNKFKQAYREDAPLLMHRALADITIDAAIEMHQNHAWTTVVFDGLRTMEAGFILYRNADPQWLADGLLAKPGESAHNRGLAVDSMAFDANGREVDMGGHFDSANMVINHRNYNGLGISPEAKQNRLIREQAFQRAAIKQGTVIAPLRSEFWDDRMPGSEKDLWRVMESVCRCTGESAPSQKAEDYETFVRQWYQMDEEKLVKTFGAAAMNPPPKEAIIFHEKFNPIYDRDLPQPMRLAAFDPSRGFANRVSVSMGR